MYFSLHYDSLGTSAEAVLKKYWVMYPVETPQKCAVLNRTVSYHAVEKLR